MFSSVMQDKFPARDAFVQYAFVARGHSIVMLQTPTHSTAETFDRVIKQTVQCTILLHFLECLNLLQKNPNATPWVTEMRWLFKEGASDVARRTLCCNCAVLLLIHHLRYLLSRLYQEVHRVSSPADGFHRLLVAGVSQIHTTHLGQVKTQRHWTKILFPT